MNFPIDDKPIRDVLGDIYSDAYTLGVDVAKETLVSSVTFDWDKWVPGYGTAADLVRGKDGLKNLLTSRNTTIQGMNKTSLQRLGNALAQALAEGLPVDATADLIEETLTSPDRALMIAQTETNRAMCVASMETYQDAGVEEVEWLVAEGCADCQQNADASPIPMGATFPTGDTEPPAHPNCLCDISPVIANELSEEDFDALFEASKMDKYDVNQPRDENGRWTSSTPESVIAVEGARITAMIDKSEKDYKERWAKVEEASKARYELYLKLQEWEIGKGPQPVDETGKPLTWDDYPPASPDNEIWMMVREEERESFGTSSYDDQDQNPTIPVRGTTDRTWNDLRDKYVVADTPTLKMNEGLRAGNSRSENSILCRGTDALVDRVTVQQDTVLYRGTALPPEIHEQLVPGATYTDAGFQSTDHGRSGGALSYANSRLEDERGSGDEEVVLTRILVEGGKGYHAAPVSYGEVVLPRNTTMEVVNRTVNDEGIVVIDVKVVGQ